MRRKEDMMISNERDDSGDEENLYLQMMENEYDYKVPPSDNKSNINIYAPLDEKIYNFISEKHNYNINELWKNINIKRADVLIKRLRELGDNEFVDTNSVKGCVVIDITDDNLVKIWNLEHELRHRRTQIFNYYNALVNSTVYVVEMMEIREEILNLYDKHYFNKDEFMNELVNMLC